MTRLLNLTLAGFVRGLTLLAVFAVLAIVGLDLLFDTDTVRSYGIQTDKWVPLSQMDEVTRFSLGVFCFLLPAFYLALGRVKRVVERGIVGRGSDGQHIRLDSEAVSRTIAREVKNQVEEVMTIRSCETWQGWGSPKVRIRVAISDRAPVPAVQAKVKRVAQEVLTGLIGYASASNVRVIVNEIAGASTPRRRKSRPAPALTESLEAPTNP